MSMKGGVSYFGATLPPRVRQVWADSGMSQNLFRKALRESCFARGCENEDQEQIKHGSAVAPASQNYLFLRTDGRPTRSLGRSDPREPR